MNAYAIKFLSLIGNNPVAFDQRDVFRYVGTPDYGFLKITFKFIEYRGQKLNAILYFPKTWSEVNRAYKIITS